VTTVGMTFCHSVLDLEYVYVVPIVVVMDTLSHSSHIPRHIVVVSHN